MSCQSCRESPQIRFVLDCEEKLKRTLLICDLWELMTFLLGPQAERGGAADSWYAHLFLFRVPGKLSNLQREPVFQRYSW